IRIQETICGNQVHFRVTWGERQHLLQYTCGGTFSSRHASSYPDDEGQVLGVVIEKRIGIAMQLAETIDMEPKQVAQREIDLFDFLHRQWFIQRVKLTDIFLGQYIIGMPVECFPSIAGYMAKGGVCNTIVCFDHSGGVGEGTKLIKKYISRVYHPVILLLALARSEEHTSELQSRENIVCRLLL